MVSFISLLRRKAKSPRAVFVLPVAALALSALALAPAAQAQVIVTIGAGSAVMGTPNRTATFDAVTDTTDLSNYAENALSITVPKVAFTSFGPSGGNGGFSGGFFYPRAGVNAYAVLRGTDNARLFAVEFNAGSGFFGNTQAFVYYQALSGGDVVGSGALAVTKGSVLGFSSAAGFDTLNFGAAETLVGASKQQVLPLMPSLSITSA